jgi:anti-sigma regulatory factor (Ser/Thr protein kinase)
VCERQAHVIATLAAAVAKLRGGSAALKAENAELRAAAGRIRGGTGAGVSGREHATGVLEASLPLDARAPGAARIVVARLRGRVPAPVLDTAQLLVSELVTNSVRHSGASAGASVVVRVRLTDSMVRLEVSDPGCDGVIAPRVPDLQGGGGVGLNLVGTLSERWGLERIAGGGTRVWAQLARAPAASLAGPGS